MFCPPALACAKPQVGAGLALNAPVRTTIAEAVISARPEPLCLCMLCNIFQMHTIDTIRKYFQYLILSKIAKLLIVPISLQPHHVVSSGVNWF